MTRKEPPVNLAASVRARLDAIRKLRGVDLELLLSEYAIERLLYRLGMSRHADRFVLKGATLFRVWSEDKARATWDLDLLGREAANMEAMTALIRELCALEGEDGIRFPPDSVKATFSGRSHPLGAETPVALEPGFLDQNAQRSAWLAFIRRARLPADTDTGEISRSLRKFLLPVWQVLRQELPFTQRWRPGGPWSPKEDFSP